MRFGRDFYERPTLEVARDLLGQVLVHRRGSVVTSGVIVEVEAYIGEDDPACHAARGRTPRNAPMYGQPGRAYVYLNYGIHALFNIVTEPSDRPAAVLIRALEPLDGVSTMRRRRARAAVGRRQVAGASIADASLCRGPGNLTVAMGIGLGHNRADLTQDRLCVEPAAQPQGLVVWTPRIGIRVGTDRLWRAVVDRHPCLSGGSAGRPAANGLTPPGRSEYL